MNDNKTNIESVILKLFQESTQETSELDRDTIERIIKDIDINSALNKINRAVAGREYSIETDNEELKNKIEEIQLLFKNIKFNRIFNFMLKARLYGYSCFEIIYDEDYGINSLIPIPHKNVSYNTKEKKWELKIGDKVIEITYEKFLLCIHEFTPSKVTGNSILESCNTSFLDKELFRNQLRGISKKYGDVIMIFPFEAGEDEEETKQRAEAIKKAKGGNVIGIPVENFGGPNSTNLKDNLHLIKLSDLDPDIYTKLEKIEKVKLMQNILGSTLTMDVGEKGTQALGTVHMDAETQVVEECCAFISDCLGNIFKSLMLIRGEDYSEFYFKLSPPNDINIQLEIEKKEEEVKSFKLDNFLKLQQVGYKPTIELISESLGIATNQLEINETEILEFASKKKDVNEIKLITRKKKDEVLDFAEKSFLSKFTKEIKNQIISWGNAIVKSNITQLILNFDKMYEHMFLVFILAYINDVDNIILEFDEKEIINPFDLKFHDAIKFVLDKKPFLFENIDIFQEEIKAKIFWVKRATEITSTNKLLKELQKNIENGGTLKDWKNDISSVIDNLGMGNDGWYTTNVYRTNVLSVYNAGHYKQQEENKINKPYWLYDGIDDNRQSSICKELDGKVYRSDNEVWNKIYPPNHYQCRSSVISLDDDDLSDYNLSVTKPNKAVQELDLGSFEGNPANSYWKNLEKNVTKNEIKMSENLKLFNEMEM